MITPLTTTAEPLDPISPLPDVPPAEDAAETQTIRMFVQRSIGIIMDGRRYWHPILAAYVGQYVDTRYDLTDDALIVLGEDGNEVCRAWVWVSFGYDPSAFILPPPTEPWMGALHEAFSASPADTANAALRARVAELEAQLGSSARTDAYYNGGAVPHADQMAANEAAYLSQRTAQLDTLDAAIEAFGVHPQFVKRVYPSGLLDYLIDGVWFIRNIIRKIAPLYHIQTALADLQEHVLKQREVLDDLSVVTWQRKCQRVLWRVLIGAPAPEDEAMSERGHALAATSMPSQILQAPKKPIGPIARLHHPAADTAAHPPRFPEGFCALGQAQSHSEAQEIQTQLRETALHICTCGNLSVDSLKSDRADFMGEMAAWPPVYEAPGPPRPAVRDEGGGQ